ncbi:hypothetical protein ANCCAN_27337 [Ancylostoma caninum]|uniref:Uncharacterized protein n=1 Tax=Ancylostoma caninum TaxID=29170 RepID=A0A368F491_ANCCA|nr:hypothetical protein ANCCAN_27337 [Ancylostoma caninum]
MWAFLGAVRRFVPEAVVMSLDGAVNDEKTVGVHVYEPFEITRIMQIVPSPATDSASVTRVRSLLKNAHIVELDRKQGDLAERYVALPSSKLLFSTVQTMWEIVYIVQKERGIRSGQKRLHQQY